MKNDVYAKISKAIKRLKTLFFPLCFCDEKVMFEYVFMRSTVSLHVDIRHTKDSPFCFKGTSPRHITHVYPLCSAVHCDLLRRLLMTGVKTCGCSPEAVMRLLSPWDRRSSLSLLTSSFSSLTSRAFGSSLMTALHFICLALSAYLQPHTQCCSDSVYSTYTHLTFVFIRKTYGSLGCVFTWEYWVFLHN